MMQCRQSVRSLAFLQALVDWLCISIESIDPSRPGGTRASTRSKKVKVAHTRVPNAYVSGTDPGSWQSACR